MAQNDAGRGTKKAAVVAQQDRRAQAAIGLCGALMALAVMTGCQGAKATPVPCAPALSNPVQLKPSKPGDVLLDGTLDCQYANDALTNCVLIAGATLDDLANAELKGTAVVSE